MHSPVTVAGVDLAWQTARNPSAIAWGQLASGVLIIDGLERAVVGLDAVHATLAQIPALTGIAIDAPLIINNETGMRDCERSVAAEWASRRASCHPANLKLYPDADSVALSRRLLADGFSHFDGERWQFECYPHPSIVEIFGLPERLLYKKGSVADKRRGQAELAALLESLSEHAVLSLEIPQAFAHYLSAERIAGLKGQALKSNEDALDALVCVYVAALKATGNPGVLHGDTRDGYIWLPSMG